MNKRTVAPALAGALTITCAAAAQTCLQHWSDDYPAAALDLDILDLAVFDDGAGPALFAAGNLSVAGGMAADGVARWDGKAWSPLHVGQFGSASDVVAIDDGGGPALFVSGFGNGTTFTSSIFRWDGTTSIEIATGIDGVVWDLAWFDDGDGGALYAGGEFTQISGVAASNLARWDGVTWSAVGGGVGGDVFSRVFGLGVFDDGSGAALFMAGSFTTAGGTPASNVARWDGTSFSDLGGGLNSAAWALAVHDDGTGPRLYASGVFSEAGGVPAERVAAWDGSAWSAVGGDLAPGIVFTLASWNGRLYGAGRDLPGGTVVRLDDATWVPIATSESSVVSLLPFDDGNGEQLHAGGNFYDVDGARAVGVARYNGRVWSAPGTDNFGNGLSSSALAIAEYDADGPGGGEAELFAGGFFRYGGDQLVNRIARRDGDTWASVDGGANDAVRALLTHDDGTGDALYAAGRFDEIGGVTAPRIARWNGASWSDVGGGFDGGSFPRVDALAVFDDGSGPRLFAGGNFQTAGPAAIAAFAVAAWDGKAWSPVGRGFDDVIVSVQSFAAFDAGTGPALYAGGFLQSGFGGLVNVARWDGREWTDVRTGTDDTVWSLVVFDDGTGPALYAAEDGGLLRYDGTDWSFVATTNDRVEALTIRDDGSGPALVVGGEFTAVDGVPFDHLAQWDGLRWTDVAGGVNGFVRTLYTAPTSGDLYVGGVISQAGGVSSHSIARLECIECAADVDESGAVDIIDLLAVLAAWGPCDACVADIDGDGVVGFLDLLRVLAEWGPCPA
ncbi:MAG: hypothetical protein HKO59_04410 [Phycisphaerales bacterium]|nr:hypothetical protein [Phycisphaerae bacterium]NNF44864.1 hypothetical protein [Phycisphaerales bacterium]NNM25219.1 hypothetical protein [Phycisphaerales bacterium]